jgi:2-dehydropantoate 2-reductase
VAGLTVWCVGAGAIGGTVAARLSRAGHDPVVVDADPQHVATLRDPGLVVEGDGDDPVALDAFSPEAAADLDRPCDLLLLSVRSDDTQQALAPFADRAGDVVSLQNGLNEDRIAALVGAGRTIGCVVTFAATWLEPGRVQLTAPGGLTIGRLDGSTDPRLDAAQALLADAFPTELSADIVAQLWSKILINAVTVLGAVGGMLTGEVLDPDRRRIVHEAVAEAVDVATAEGVRLPHLLGVDPVLIAGRGPGWADQLDRVLDAMAEHAGQVKSVTLRDFELGRRPEVDAVTGEIVRRGERHGVPTPVNESAYRILLDIAAGNRRPEPTHFDELRQALG